jgi:hypothetical protein
MDNNDVILSLTDAANSLTKVWLILSQRKSNKQIKYAKEFFDMSLTIVQRIEELEGMK